MKHLFTLKNYFGLLMDWLATPIVWLFWPIRERWLGKNIANGISLTRLPLMIWVLSKLINADVAVGWVLVAGCAIMIGLSAWSYMDYSDDLRELQMEYYSA